MTETQSTRTGRKTRCHLGKHPGMLHIVTRDRGGRDDVMRKSPIFLIQRNQRPFFVYVDLQSTSHCRTFSFGTHTTVKVRLQEIVGSDRSLQKVSDVDRRTNTIHVRSAFSFARCALGRPNELKRRLSRSNGERFPPCLMALWSEHYVLSIASSLATLF